MGFIHRPDDLWEWRETGSLYMRGAEGQLLDVEVYYDQEGGLLTRDEYQELKYGPASNEYRRVGSDVLPDGKWVSTVWTGRHEHPWIPRPPLIYESAVYSSYTSFHELDRRLYPTLDEAVAGHQELVRQWTEHPEGIDDDA